MKALSMRLLALVMIVTVWSCTKENATPPATTSADQDELMAGEIVTAEPTPGVYRIVRFIDTGDDETSQFNGYRFRFEEDGDFIARTNTGQIFRGFWDLNSAETMMELSISGTEALEDLDDDDWRVGIITDTRIRLTAPDPDIVVFQRIQ